jgi:hypothetical protein
MAKERDCLYLMHPTGGLVTPPRVSIDELHQDSHNSTGVRTSIRPTECGQSGSSNVTISAAFYFLNKVDGFKREFSVTDTSCVGPVHSCVHYANVDQFAISVSA